METAKIILLASLWHLIAFFFASLVSLWQSYQKVAGNYIISAVCGNALVKVARTLLLAAKS